MNKSMPTTLFCRPVDYERAVAILKSTQSVGEVVQIKSKVRLEVMDTVYTLAQIKEHWEDYKTANYYKVLKDGKWSARKTMPDMGTEAITKCEMVKAYKAMSFPRYLEMLGD